MNAPHLGRIFLVSLGHLIEALGIPNASLGEDLFCMVFLLLMVLY
jgi:hypothetical protein